MNATHRNSTALTPAPVGASAIATRESALRAYERASRAGRDAVQWMTAAHLLASVVRATPDAGPATLGAAAPAVVRLATVDGAAVTARDGAGETSNPSGPPHAGAGETANPSPAPAGRAKRQAAAPRPLAAPLPYLDAKPFAEALARVCRVVERIHSRRVPEDLRVMLGNVRLHARGDVLEIMATDLDMVATERLHAPGVGHWETTVNAGQLLDAMKRAKAGAVTFTPGTEADDRLHVAVGALTTAYPVLAADDFPIMDPVQAAAVIFFDAAALVASLKAVQLAISTEETRYYLSGAFLHVATEEGEERLRLVATDGHRLVLEPLAGERDHAGPVPPVIIPRKAVDWLIRCAPKAGSIAAEIAGSQVTFTTERATLQTKVIDGSFPDYCRVIPAAKDRPIKWEAESDALASVVAQLATVSNDKAKPIRLEAVEGAVTGSMRNVESGMAEAALPITHTGGDTLIGFNSRYLLDALGLGERVTMHLGDGADPVRVEFPDKPGRIAVLMPLRV